ncbi:MAG TPA: melibiose:sodium transporter MelB [Candidatus Anaerobiospirillum stercoravium]|nr:melibiose:sodium transporter MelB [Candidatus Anaerobiospirillum stercoravium]
MAESPVTLKEKVSFGLGAVGKDMAYAAMAVYLMMYFTDVVGVSAAFVGVVFLFARLWDAFNDPIMGWIVDNTKSRWGKFRPWILIGTLVNSIIAILLFTNPVHFFDLSMGQAMAYCAVFYILWGMSYTIMDIPYWSFIPAFSSDSKVRDVMSVIPRTGAMIGGQFVTIFGLSMITWLGVTGGSADSEGFQRYLIFVCVVFIALELICVTNIHEHVQTPLRQKITIKGMLNILFKNDQLLVIIVLTIIQQIGQNLVNGTILYYFKYVLISEDSYPYFMAAGAIAQFVAFVTFPKLVEKTSRRFVYIGSGLLMIVGYLGMFLLGGEGAGIYLACGAYCVASLGVALSLVSTTVMLADTVDYGEYKLGTRAESIVFSMQTMTVKFGTALAGFLSGLTLTLVGYVPNVQQSEGTLLGLRVVMFVVSSIILLVMLLLYIKYYKLNGDFYKNMLSALQVSRDQAKAKRASTRFVRAALDEQSILLDVQCSSKDELLALMVHNLVTTGKLKAEDEATLLQAIQAREAQGPTGIADGIALPHAKCDCIGESALVIAKLAHGLDFAAPDGKPCDLVFLLASVNDGNAHLNVIGRLGLILNDPENVKHIRECHDAYRMVEIIAHAEKHFITDANSAQPLQA